jgi:HJR/Mrr/RecB family endonuclease
VANKNTVALLKLVGKPYLRVLCSWGVCFYLKKIILKISLMTGHPIFIPDFVITTLSIVLAILTGFVWRKLVKPLVIFSAICGGGAFCFLTIAKHYKTLTFLNKTPDAQLFFYVAVFGIIGGLILARKIFRRIARPFYFKTMEQIDAFGNGNSKIGGTLFEDYLVNLYRQLGYNASSIAELKRQGIIKMKSVDQGADILIEYQENGQIKKAIVQCKHYCNTVGNKAVQEASFAREFYNNKFQMNIAIAMVITNNYFTPQAVEAAQHSNVVLVDRDQLKILNERSAQPKLAQMMERIKSVA